MITAYDGQSAEDYTVALLERVCFLLKLILLQLGYQGDADL